MGVLGREFGELGGDRSISRAGRSSGRRRCTAWGRSTRSRRGSRAYVPPTHVDPAAREGRGRQKTGPRSISLRTPPVPASSATSLPLPTAVKYATPLPRAIPEPTTSPTFAVDRPARGHPPSRGSSGRSCRQCSVGEVDRRRGDPAAGRTPKPASARVALGAQGQGVDPVGEDRPSVGGAARLQAADLAGQGQDSRVVGGRRDRRRAGVERACGGAACRRIGPKEVEGRRPCSRLPRPSSPRPLDRGWSGSWACLRSTGPCRARVFQSYPHIALVPGHRPT